MNLRHAPAYEFVFKDLHVFRPAPVVQPLDLKVETPDLRNNNNEHDDKMYEVTVEVKAILSKRKSVEARMSTQQFFKTVYNSIEQEMLSEQDPNSTACHDPYVEKLLEKLIVSVDRGITR